MRYSTLFSFIFSLIVFFILNIPSVKIFYSSGIINILLFVAVWSVGLARCFTVHRGRINLSTVKIRFLFLFLIIWSAMLFVTLMKSPNAFNLMGLIQYLITISMVVAVLLFFEAKDIPKLIYYQVIWGTFLGVMQVTVGVNLDSALGQHYLTLGMPISAGIVCAVALLFYKKTSKKVNVLLIASVVFSMLAVLSLSGRSPVLLAVIVPVAFIILIFILDRNLFKKAKTVLGVVFLAPIAFYLIYTNMSEESLDRFLRVSNFEEEPRNLVYSRAIKAIKEYPFGAGLDSMPQFGHSYPHNIFLEVALSGGIITLSLFIFVMLFIFKRVLVSAKAKSYAVCCGALAIYFFLFWNISFNLVSSYIPFSAIAILICATENKAIAMYAEDDLKKIKSRKRRLRIVW